DQRVAGHEGEGPAGELEAVDVLAEPLEQVLQVPPARHRVVGPPDLGHASRPRSALPPVGPQERERPGVIHLLLLHGPGYPRGPAARTAPRSVCAPASGRPGPGRRPAPRRPPAPPAV